MFTDGTDYDKTIVGEVEEDSDGDQQDCVRMKLGDDKVYDTQCSDTSDVNGLMCKTKVFQGKRPMEPFYFECYYSYIRDCKGNFAKCRKKLCE